MSLTLPLLGQIAAGYPRKPGPIHDSFQSIVDKFNANIVDADISATANIQGTKLLNASITASDKLVDLSINAAKLAADAVTTVKILDLNVTNAKIANGDILFGKLKMLTTTLSVSGVVSLTAGTGQTLDLSSATPGTGWTGSGTALATNGTGRPWAVEMTKSGGGTITAAWVGLHTTIYRNTTDNKLYLSIFNASGANIAITGLVLNVYSFSVA